MAQNNADFLYQFSLKNADGSDFDLTGYNLEAQLKFSPDTLPVLTLSTGNGRIVINTPATDGVFFFTLPYSVMKTIFPGIYYFDIVNIVSSSSHEFIAAGILTVDAGITEAPIAYGDLDSGTAIGSVTIIATNQAVTITGSDLPVNVNASLITYDDSSTLFGVSNVQDAIEFLANEVGVGLASRTVTSSFSILNTDKYIRVTSGAVVATLGSHTSNLEITIKNVSGTSVTANGTVDGVVNPLLISSPGFFIKLFYTHSTNTWEIIG